MKHLIVLAVAVPSILIAFFSCTSMSTFTLPPVAMASTSIDTLTTADIFDPSKVTGFEKVCRGTQSSTLLMERQQS